MRRRRSQRVAELGARVSDGQTLIVTGPCPSPNRRYKRFAVRATAGETLRRRGDRRQQNAVLAARARGPCYIDFAMACSQRRATFKEYADEG
jgi:hypothetical protein